MYHYIHINTLACMAQYLLSVYSSQMLKKWYDLKKVSAAHSK